MHVLKEISLAQWALAVQHFFKGLRLYLSRVFSSHFLSPPDQVSVLQHLVLLLVTAGRAAAGVAVTAASVLFASLGSLCA